MSDEFMLRMYIAAAKQEVENMKRKYGEGSKQHNLAKQKLAKAEKELKDLDK